MKLEQNVRPWVAAVFAVFALAVMEGWRDRLATAAGAAASELARVEAARREVESAREQTVVLRDLKARDLSRFKQGLAKLTQSRRALYESGLQLQEEKRQLEKLWELLTTYLMLDQIAGKVNVMRGDQALIAFPTAGLQRLGGVTQPVAALERIVAKERFAAPERGASETREGRLEWQPPQQGTSLRASALGEYVLFTEGPLILHGPAKDPKAHAAYAHACLGLSAYSAQRLYDRASVGTKVLLRK